MYLAGMSGVDLAAGFIVQFLFLKRLNLSFCEDTAVFGNSWFQCLETGLEVGQIVAHAMPHDQSRRR